MRAFDWSDSPLGPPESWPQPLKTLMGVMLAANQPMFVAWGPERTLLYNDAYSAILAAKHPGALARDFLEVWSEIKADLIPIVDAAYAGQPVHMDDIELVMERRGYPEETHFAFSYTPVRDETGAVAGFFCPLAETTGQVLAERRLAAETERQRRLFQQAPGFITALSGPDHVFDFVNEAYVRLFGDRDFVGKTVRKAFPEIADQGFFELLGQVYATGERFIAHHVPIRLKDAAGAEQERFLDFIYEPVKAEDGRVTGIFCEGHDVTDIHRAQEALRESESRFRFLDALGKETAKQTDADAVLATTTRMVAEHLGISNCAYADMDEDQDGFTIRGNWAAPGSPSILGHYSLADFGKLAVERLGAGLPLVINDNLAELAPEEAATFQNIGIAATICVPLVKEGRLTALMAIHDKVRHAWTEAELALILEVTERSWAHVERVGAEGALRESEARQRAVVQAAPIGLVFADASGRITGGNAQVERILGHPVLPSNSVEEYGAWVGFHPDGRQVEGHEYPLARALAGEEERPEMEVLYRRGDGREVWVRFIAAPIRDVSGRISGGVVASLDVDREKRAEAELRQLNATLEERVSERTAERNLLATIVETTDVLVMAADLDYNILAINKANADEFERIYGVRPKAGDNMLKLLEGQPEHQEQVRAGWGRALGGEEVTFLEEFGDPTLDRPYYEIKFRTLKNADGELVGAYHFVTDVTERLRAQAQLVETQEALRQSQKMEAMGQLTGGVAHDFNNLLTPIVGSLDMLQRRRVGSEREQRMIGGALESAERAKTLVQRLLAFARRQPLQPVAVGLGALMQGMAGLLGSTLGPAIKVRVELPDDLPPAKADPNQLEMAILNLSVNARDAMPDGGTLTIAAARESVRSGHRSKVRQGHYVRLSVSDTGIGMDEATLKRAVEPFFSTKGIGKGTGLGLSMVHGLAAQLGGALHLASEPGRGTTVELWLPVSTEPLDTDGQMPSTSPAVRARGRALLVDDEELVRMSTADMLGDLGYEVIEAGSAEEALRLVRKGAALDLLVTDHLMPGMSGADLAREVRRLRPGMPVLIVSGYAEVEGIAPDLPRLTKPFRNADLAASLTAMADGKAPNS